MKILLLITEMGSGGAERQLSGLASMLTGRGHETRVCWMQGENFYSDALSEASVSELCLNASSRIMRMMKTAREIRRFHPDTVIAFLDGAISSALRVRKFFPWLRFRLIVSERNVTQNFTPEQNAKFRAYRRADAIVCNSFTQTENLRRRFPELAGRIATITNFVDLERFRPAEEENRNSSAIPKKSIPITATAVKDSDRIICMLERRYIRSHRWCRPWRFFSTGAPFPAAICRGSRGIWWGFRQNTA